MVKSPSFTQDDISIFFIKNIKIAPVIALKFSYHLLLLINVLDQKQDISWFSLDYEKQGP